AGRARCERQRALHVGLRDRVLSGRPRRRAHQPHARHHARHGHRDHRRGVRGGGHRRPWLLLGDGSGGGVRRAGAVVRPPVLPGLFHLRVLRPHGRRADRPALGLARTAAQVMAALARVPWGLVILVAAFFVPVFGSRFYVFLANDIVIWALFA